VFSFQGRNNFTRVQRAVDAARALRELGYDKAKVRHAIERAKTHVGNSDLSLAQWVEIATGYVSRAIS
jgi:Holliday junction resolvasome RuvABC DNA-binding subunit